ncbi:MAG: IS66 family transposase [Thaumarchaeota archaeon]|nr:IS66 family transposase [Nitrososphaerota archaeon]
MTIESLFSELQTAQTEVSGLKSLLLRKDERIGFYEQEVEHLKEVILSLRRQAFGPKKERWESEEQGVLIFNEAEREAAQGDDSAEDVDGAEAAPVKVGGHTRARGKRKPLPAHLEREIQVVELPEEERKAADGTPLKVIGKEVSEKLSYEPPKLKVIEIHRLRYGFDGEPVKTAPPPPSIIPKGIVTASLLSAIVVAKYGDGLPLYRQEEIFGRLGVELSRGSMARWIVQSSQACLPIWKCLEGRLMERDYISCDETHTQVLKETGRSAESKSWMWVRATPADEKKIVLFDYDPHRSGEVARRLLSEFRGFLQVDGYSSYNWTAKTPEIQRIGCNMHGRRGFEEALKLGSKSGHTLAKQGLKYYKILYDLEEEAKKKGMTWEERFEFRAARAAPVWDELEAWAGTNAPKVPPSSKIGEAFGYFQREIAFLRGYLRHGKIEPDNGFIERMIRKFGIGRNNWLFSDTEAGADASAVFYSLIVTAKANAVNPLTAMRTILGEVPLAKTLDDYERLADLLLSPADK